MGYVPFDGTLNSNGFPKGKVGTKYKVHLPENTQTRQVNL
jgi:aminomethyltransferase